MSVGIVAQRVADAHYRVERAAVRHLVKFLDGTYPRSRDTWAFDHESVHCVPPTYSPGHC